MSIPRKSRRVTKAAFSLLAAGAVVGGLLVGTTPATAAPEDGPERTTKPLAFEDGRYIVTLREPAAAQYGGGGRYARTAARGDQQFNARTTAVRVYTDHLRTTHRRIAGQIGADVQRSFTMALNGFVADLSGEQAADLVTDRRVLSVTKEKRVRMDTWHTPAFLGLTGAKGVWAQNGGRLNAGDGVVIGVLDTGIWPESKSFAGAPLTRNAQTKWDIRRIGKRTYMDKADGSRFQGFCQTGVEFDLSDCNSKIISARYYDSYYQTIPDELKLDTEYVSPRDGGGHGSHTAGTAAGNAGVRAVVEGRRFGRISGMAPAAKIAVYKVLWEAEGDDYDGGSNADIVAAINDAVADGVDVLNYSIGGGVETDVADPTLMAFEGAAEAGIFIATSASNNGPDPETVEKQVPWLTSVAASTHYSFENTVVLGNGEKVVGASIADTPVPSTPLVDSRSAAPDGATEPQLDDAELCGPDTLDPAKVTGKIVVCTRGSYDRVAKSAEVERAGGVAMILANPGAGSLDADFHAVPTVHVASEGAQKVWDYIDAAGAGATARFVLGNTTGQVTPVPQIAGFSGRGPASMVEGDMIKPDITAPGVSVLAAVAPPSNSGRRFDLYSGTSMSSPHIAGLAAFMAGRRPGWSPMAIKSAMMTTAKNIFDEEGNQETDPFVQGAGHVRPWRMFDPGLVVVSDKADWLGFVSGQGYDTGIRPIAAKDVNQPSMAEGEMVGQATFHREFTATRAGRWRVSVDVPGMTAAHRTWIVTKRRGDVADLRITFTRTDAPLGEFTSGFVTLTGPTTVRIPVALRPVSVDAPTEVQGSGVDGEVEVPLTAGFTGEVPVDTSGLEQALTGSDTITPGDPSNDPHAYCVTIAPDSKVLRVDVDAAQDDADLDLYVIKTNDACTVGLYLAGQSATGSADESVTVPDPEPGTYYIEVDGFAPGEGETDVDYRIDVFAVNATAGVGNFTVDPNPVPVVAGETTSFMAQWSGLTADRRYLGVLEYEGALSPTYVLVDTSD